jgi:hypothetical protein
VPLRFEEAQEFLADLGRLHGVLGARLVGKAEVIQDWSEAKGNSGQPVILPNHGEAMTPKKKGA